MFEAFRNAADVGSCRAGHKDARQAVTAAVKARHELSLPSMSDRGDGAGVYVGQRKERTTENQNQ